MVKCNDCQTEAVAKSSKTGKCFYVCPACPGTGTYKEKFLTWVDDMDDYIKKGCLPKGKRKAPLTDAQSYAAGAKKGEASQKKQRNNEYELLNAKVDKLLQIVEGLLKKEKPEEEVSEEEEEEGSDS